MERKRINRRYCCVFGCSNREGREKNVTFYRFPKVDTEQAKLWIAAVSRLDENGKLWQPLESSRVCSTHFLNNEKSSNKNHPSYVPSIFPSNHRKKLTMKDLARFKRAEQRHQEQQQSQLNLHKEGAETNSACMEGETPDMDRRYEEDEETDSVCTEDETPKSDTIDFLSENQSQPHQLSPLKISINYCTQTPAIWKSSRKRRRISVAEKIKRSTMSNKKVQTDPPKKRSVATSTDQMISHFEALMISSYSERQFRSFCGITRNLYRLLFAKCEGSLTNSNVISKQDKLYLTLVKLKLNLSYDVLGGLFDVGSKTARNCFLETLELFYEATKPMVIWFDRATIQARMPPAFKTLFPKTRVIIDASEIECQRPRTVPLRVQFYSSYKSRFTIKYLVGIAPSGEITFISQAYGGRTTDMEITVNSGFLDLIEPNDLVLADKGFPSIETRVMENGGTLVMPPFKSGKKQFTREENKFGYESASVRIHVERAIGRMKLFEIMNFAQTCNLHLYDRILVIISAFCNCFPDLVAQK